MQPMSTKGGGQCALAGPTDTCNTPGPSGTAPAPYPSFAECSQAKGSTCSQQVKVDNAAPLTKKSEISRTSGDEAGTQKGVMSGTQMDICVFKEASDKVKIEGAKVVCAMMMTAHNGSNANAPTGSQVSPSQTKVTVGG